jgi:hypothetical protein
MRPTIAQLRGWNAGQLTDAGTTAQDNATALDSAIDAVVRAMYSNTQWSGRTRFAAQEKINEEQDHASEVRNVLQQIADEAKDAAHDLDHSRRFVLGQVDGALQDGCVVSDTGEVTHPDEAKKEIANSYESHINRGLTTIDTLDEDYGSRIEVLQGDLVAMVNGQPDVVLPDGTSMDGDAVISKLRGMSDEERRALLASMSEQDIRRLIQADPVFMGNTNGIPFAVRTVANEVNIRNAIINEVQAGNDVAGKYNRVEKLRELLRQQNDPTQTAGRDENTDGAVDDRKVERQFISFENTGNGRFVEMIGSLAPGTKNATVYVPGTGSNLNGSNTNTSAAWNLAQATVGPVFVVMDGDLPQDMGYEGLGDVGKRGLEGAIPSLLGGGPIGLPGAVGGLIAGGIPGISESIEGSAADPQFARDMAPRLVDFGRELDAEIAERAPAAKTTFIGHSYGGSVVGSAEQLGLNADRVIYASSAGTGVFDGEWQNADPNVERFSLTAPGDPIQYIQSMPGSPHGGDPDSMPGVTRLDTGSYSDENRDYPAGIVEGGRGHGGYWDDRRSGGFQNMVEVVTGGEPTLYVERGPDRPTDPAWDVVEEIAGVSPLGPLLDSLDGDVDLPGPLPDVPLQLPW